jgi:hypothetical protein
MPDDTEQRFFVYGVESPSAGDFYVNRGGAAVLVPALSLAGVVFRSRTVINRDQFLLALRADLVEQARHYPSLVPFVQITAHGDDKGFNLSDGTEITWQELRDVLLPVNRVYDGLLTLCMSSCQGATGVKAAMADGELPFLAVIGPLRDVIWSDAVVAYLTFYNLLRKGRTVSEAVDGMNAAIAEKEFMLLHARDGQATWLELGKAIGASKVVQGLDEVAAAAVPAANPSEGSAS